MTATRTALAVGVRLLPPDTLGLCEGHVHTDEGGPWPVGRWRVRIANCVCGDPCRWHLACSPCLAGLRGNTMVNGDGAPVRVAEVRP